MQAVVVQRVVPLLGVALGWLGPVTPAAAGAGGGGTDPAARFLRVDPGARVGGNTQVAAAARARLVGVPRRVNFMLGLGPRQRIVGGRGHDQLGVRGLAGRIFGAGGPDLIHGGPGRDRLHGGRGRDLIYGGGGRDLISGGPGRDRVIDRSGAAIVRAGGGDRVEVADGDGDDQVLCTAGWAARLAVDRHDRVDPSCSGRAEVTYRRPVARAAQQPVTGNGSNDNPYTAPCDNPQLIDCTVSSFGRRSLTGWWTHEFVPAYKCPADHPYLLGRWYAPFGTFLPQGVEVDGLGPIGVAITGWSSTTPPGQDFLVFTGTTTGYPNSSATSWRTETNYYRVILHCTSDWRHHFNPNID